MYCFMENQFLFNQIKSLVFLLFSFSKPGKVCIPKYRDYIYYQNPIKYRDYIHYQNPKEIPFPQKKNPITVIYLDLFKMSDIL